MSDFEPGDFRRAAALISHRASGNNADVIEGVLAIIRSAVDAGRLVYLFRAVDYCYRAWVGELRTERSREMVDGLIADIANTPPADDIGHYNQLAARAIIAMKAEDGAQFTVIAEEANASSQGGDGGSRLVGALADLYHYVLPELATASGRQSLSEWTASIAQYENARNPPDDAGPICP